ncbi:acyl transferase/acyl hydrolase/lysophospholipase [Gaertneriomyces semiglobifer]|nr:acyl transferase/acyl hydrolase/lysophospholipase [Gaertneriomyces semiglobifer]
MIALLTWAKGLLRNLGGMCDPRLFARSYLGTKLLIEDYINEIVRKLEFIRNARSLDNSQKLEFFHDTRQSFGNTALLLQGGATFGLYHLGVVKALNEHRILPRIISGTSVGALIAALVCVHTEDELPRIFEKGGINLRAFSRKTLTGHLRRKITRFLKHGYLMDVKVLEDCVRSNVGDITFAEAYAKTKRVLNITVAPRRKYEVPRLLNYLTAPDVLVWSAACASAATMGLYESVELLAKDSYGNIVHWVPSATTWTDVACESDSPEVKLAEQFNVNHFILSQANPYIAPFLPKGPQGQRDSFTDKVRLFLSSEIRYRLNQLGHFGLIPQALQTLFEAKMQGHITVAPALNSRDFYELFSNPTHASINYWIHKGYSSTWPYLSLIKHRVIIEMTLNEGTTL